MGLFRRKPLHQRLAEEGGLVERSTVPLFTGVIPETGIHGIPRERQYDAVEHEIARPYRATAVRRGESTWAVAAHRLRVIELPEPGGDEVELALRGDDKTLVVDGNRSFGTLPELEQLADGDAVIRASRLDGTLWEARVDPL